MTVERLPITYLFVPGSRPERFEKALNSGADRVIIDLEDAVGVEEKHEARENVVRALKAGLPRPVLIRVNPLDSAFFDDDIDELRSLSEAGVQSFGGVVFPKAESPIALGHVCASLASGLELVAMIESALGLKLVDDIIRLPKITKLALGAVDLSVDLDAQAPSPVIDYAYAKLVIASRLANKLPPVGSPPLSIDDLDSVEKEARRLRSMGVAGQLCIHPAQIAPLHAGFLPTPDEVEWAQHVMASIGASVQVDGQMVDKPVRDKAERILARAERQIR